MNKTKVLLILYWGLFLIKGYGQESDSTLIIGKPAFNLIADTSVRIELTNSLKGFLKARNDEVNPNPYIDSEYLKLSVEPFLWLRNAEVKSPNGKNLFTPTLLAVMPLGNEKYIVKLAYMTINKLNSNNPELNLITSLEVKKSNDSYYFYNTIDYNTRLYNIKQVGNIKYIYPNKLDELKAKKMDDFNTSIARKFSIKPLKITYYKSENPEQLFKILGFDYIENMYYSLSGGLAYQWNNTLFAGNNSELYEHEAVHFYTSILFKNKTRVVDEGYATYIGGSGGLNLDELAVLARKYISNNSSVDICELSTDFKTRLEGGVPITYILSALVCRDIEEKFGVEGTKKMFTPKAEDDYFTTLKRINGVEREEFPKYIKKLLDGY
jgi:hypothetical protein